MGKKRTYYSKEFKRQALIQAANCREFELFLRKNGIDIDKSIEKDKKYCSKLFYKWRKELYENNEIIYFSNNEITQDAIENELKILNDENEEDVIISELKEKIFQGVNRYRNLKKRITSGYKKKMQ